MGLRMIPPKRVKKIKSANAQEILDRINEYLESDEVTGEPVEILYRFWEDQQNAITYHELRQAVIDGAISQETLRLWSQDYSVLVSTKMKALWENAIVAGATHGQPAMDKLASFEFSSQSPGILSWINQRGAEFVTASTQEQKDAIAALLAKKMRDGHTVDELSRLIRPCIGLTEGDARAAANLYDSIVANLKKEHPRMKPESIREKALDATQKYAERKHRARAMTIAQTESAFAYNQGADEGIRQAQAQKLIGAVKKRWSTSGDDGVCEVCASLEGTEIEMDAEFEFKGKILFAGHHKLPPAHPRCACAVEYIEVSADGAMESPMATGDKWIDDYIDEYDRSIVDAGGDEAMSTRLLMSHDEVMYAKDENMAQVFAYSADSDVILYNPNAPYANRYDIKFSLTHENAHRIDYLYLHSWENKNFITAVNNTESLIMSNLDAVEKLLQNKHYGEDFAFNDLISSLTKGQANDMLFIGHSAEYLSSEFRRMSEIFADITCIDMSDSVIKKELNGIFGELYEAYKEVVAWKVPV